MIGGGGQDLDGLGGSGGIGDGLEVLGKKKRAPVSARFVVASVGEDVSEFVGHRNVGAVGRPGGVVRHEGEGDVIVEHVCTTHSDGGWKKILVKGGHMLEKPLLCNAKGQRVCLFPVDLHDLPASRCLVANRSGEDPGTFA
jgi:hypothetical protein